jgi:hypothetical protein
MTTVEFACEQKAAAKVKLAAALHFVLALAYSP